MFFFEDQGRAVLYVPGPGLSRIVDDLKMDDPGSEGANRLIYLETKQEE